MKTPVTLFLVALFFLLTPHAQACESGDVGSPECLEVQIDAQDAVADGFPYRNHGQMVNTAARVTSQAEQAGEITAECASCIVSQFARRIPIDEQELCGLGVFCPATLTPDERDRWYESGSFIGLDEITMVATFTSPYELDFATDPAETFQLWIVPKVPCDDDDPECPLIPPVTINETPLGVVPAGSIITYDLTIDVSALSSSPEKFVLRPWEHSVLGTMSPSDIPLEEVFFTCIEDFFLMAL
jgi:hypothetical protein